MSTFKYEISPEKISLDRSRAVTRSVKTVPSLGNNGKKAKEAFISLETLTFKEQYKDLGRLVSQVVWMELVYNISQDRFYVQSGNMRQHHCGQMHVEYKHRSVINSGRKFTCNRCNEEIVNFQEETSAIKAQGLDKETNRNSVLEQMRAFLSKHQFRIESSEIKDKSSNDKLTFEYNDVQRDYIAKQINDFVTKTRHATLSEENQTSLFNTEEEATESSSADEAV